MDGNNFSESDQRMRCTCGLSVPFNKAPADRRCDACGSDLKDESDDYLLYGKNGLVKTVRPGQVEMARAVERLIVDNGAGLIEGPVGVGKSFAYAVPAILSGKTIVISTAKKQLQHQIAKKDAPWLATHLEKPDLKVALIKGKSNYACRLKVFDIKETEDRRQFVDFLDKSETGDQTSAIEIMGSRPKYWYDVTAEDCIGKNCKEAARCGYWRSRSQAKTANIIVVNHHVVAFDLRFGPFKLLPKYDVLVIDEAHQAPAAFRGAFGLSVHQMGYMRVLKALDKTGMSTGLEKALVDTWKAMFDEIRNQEGEVPANPFGAHGDAVIETLAAINSMATKELKEAGGTAYDEDVDEGAAPEPAVVAKDWETITKFEMLKKNLTRQLEALRMAREPDQNTVVYITTTGDKKMKSVNVAPISVGPMVGPKLKMIPTVIVTSATLSVNGSFEDIKRQLGMDWSQTAAPVEDGSAEPPVPVKKIETLVLESPFDYRRQALLYTPKHLPLPVSGGRDGLPSLERGQYISALSTEITRLVLASDGNTFVLFSATSDMNDVYQALGEEDLRGITLITQGTDAEAALTQFMQTPRSVILGLKSFWEGVDVVGDKLRTVIVVKLPFPQMNDPVLKARERQVRKQLLDRGQSESAVTGAVFNTIQIPQMITDLRQGAGRLIRSVNDKGVLAILDPRVWTGSSKKTPLLSQSNYAGYGATAVSATGFSNRTADFGLVSRFLASIQQRAGLAAA